MIFVLFATELEIDMDIGMFVDMDTSYGPFLEYLTSYPVELKQL